MGNKTTTSNSKKRKQEKGSTPNEESQALLVNWLDVFES